jgi:hypothetical protein
MSFADDCARMQELLLQALTKHKLRKIDQSALVAIAQMCLADVIDDDDLSLASLHLHQAFPNAKTWLAHFLRLILKDAEAQDVALILSLDLARSLNPAEFNRHLKSLRTKPIPDARWRKIAYVASHHTDGGEIPTEYPSAMALKLVKSTDETSRLLGRRLLAFRKADQSRYLKAMHEQLKRITPKHWPLGYELIYLQKHIERLGINSVLADPHGQKLGPLIQKIVRYKELRGNQSLQELASAFPP